MKTNKPKARKPRAPQVPDELDDDDPLEIDAGGAGVAELEEDVDEELAQLRQELGEDLNRTRIVVHRVVQNGDPQRCFSCPFSQFYSDSIREQWGAGTYSYMVYVGNKLRTRGRISFAEPLAPPAPSTPASSPARDEARSLADVEIRFEQRLEREQARHFEMLKLLTGNRPQLDPLQMQQQLLQMLATVKELTGGSSGGADRSSIELFLEGVKMAQKFGGGGEGGTDWGAIVASVVEGAKALAHEQARAPRALSAPASSGAAPPPTAPASSDQEDEDMMGKLTKALQFLVRKAQAGANAELYADVAIDNIGELPEFVQPIVLDYLKRDDCLERLIKLEPSVAQHREWFTQLVAEIRRVLSQQNGTTPLTDDPLNPDPEG